jgi:hypothetical protein
LGGSSGDSGQAIVADEMGGAYVTGTAGSSDFPTTPGVFDPSYDQGDAFVAKLNPTGGALDYATFLGGSGGDAGYAIAVDGTGNAYVAGTTQSADFPATPGAFDTSLGGSSDCFAAKLNPSGSLLAYATFLGGSADEGGSGIAIDGAGSAYVAGTTRSADFPATPGAVDPSYNGGSYGDAFVAHLGPSGGALAYATFLGGSNDDYGNAIALDTNGNAYVTGRTYSSDFPTTPGAFDTSYDRHYDTFVVKLNPAGDELAYATFLGAASDDEGWGIAVDRNGNAFVAGWTGSRQFPTTQGSFSTSHHGSYDVFVVKITQDGSALAYGTFVGGLRNDQAYAIAVDSAGSAYVTGGTVSEDFPTTPDAFDRAYGGGSCWPPPFTSFCTDAFVLRLSADGSNLVFGSYLGGSGDGSFDLGEGIAVDGVGRPYLTGYASSGDFPTTPGAFDTSFNGGACGGIPCSDAFVTAVQRRSRWWLPLVSRNQPMR